MNLSDNNDMKKVNKKIVYCVILFLTIMQFSYKSYADEIIYGNVTWSTPRDITGYVYITPGATLEITCEIRFSSTSMIIVECQGKLQVNGGILTNLDANQLWEGILLLGDPSSPQTLNPRSQGIVSLEDALIANAECGIKVGATIKETTPNGIVIYSLVPSGGIVIAENTQFLNNRQSINFDEYIYRNGNNETDNRSCFTECSFTVDANAFFNIQDDESQVSLFGVRGVGFKGCIFSNTQSGYNGIGIYANAAGFRINDYWLPIVYIGQPPYYPTQTQFDGYRIAIDIKNSGSKAINIVNTEFSDNGVGVYAVLVNNLRIETSYFNNNASSYYSVVLQNATNYVIENNQFNGDCLGLVFLGDVPDNNYIRYNTFTNLCRASAVYGDQQKHLTNGYLSTGLQFQCNVFENNYTDIHIDGRIKFEQKGIAGHGCGNVFGPNRSLENICNLGDLYIAYYYDGALAYHNPIYYSGLFIPINFPPCDCSIFGYTGNNYYPSSERCYADVNELENQFVEIAPRLAVLISEYHQKYNDTIHWIDYWNGDDSYALQVSDYNEIVTLKDSVDMICSYAIQYVLSSVDVLDRTALITWASRIESANMDFLIAECYLDGNDIVMMNNVLNDISIKYQDYDPSNIEEYAKCLRYEYLWNLNNLDTTYINQLDLDTLNLIASGTGIASDLAKSILERIGYDIEMHDLNQLCSWPSYGNAPNGILDKNLNEINLKVIPNPTDDNVTIKSDNEDELIKKLLIFDVYGKQVLSKEVNASNININLNRYSRGAYTVHCVMSNGSTIVKKVIKK
ncbi:MAG: T9SS type A sorting domain-containing protein [Bacteroidales bacterium]|nr:T9SS type A sorting domain-containing protein [Bacteroidales bacterium]